MGTAKTVMEEGRSCCLLECGKMRLMIDPADGLNIFSVKYGGREVVRFRKDRFEEGRTYGIPILYPTPNRTRDGKYTFHGQVHKTEMHGLVKKHPFEIVSLEASEERAVLTAKVSFAEGTELYARFPYKSELEIRICVEPEQFIYTYTVKNRDMKTLPYGFALHPFFEKMGQNVKITAKAEGVMEAGEDKLPTGRVLPAEGTEFDLRNPVEVNQTDLDHVYTGISGQPCAAAEYEDFRLELLADPVFTHLVVFTPKEEFFCLENQTCSTDAVNLSQKGFEKEAHLQTVEPGEEQSGTVVFRFTGR